MGSKTKEAVKPTDVPERVVYIKASRVANAG